LLLSAISWVACPAFSAPTPAKHQPQPSISVFGHEASSDTIKHFYLRPKPCRGVQRNQRSRTAADFAQWTWPTSTILSSNASRSPQYKSRQRLNNNLLKKLDIQTASSRHSHLWQLLWRSAEPCHHRLNLLHASPALHMPKLSETDSFVEKFQALKLPPNGLVCRPVSGKIPSQTPARRPFSAEPTSPADMQHTHVYEHSKSMLFPGHESKLYGVLMMRLQHSAPTSTHLHGDSWPP